MGGIVLLHQCLSNVTGCTLFHIEVTQSKRVERGRGMSAETGLVSLYSIQIN